MFNQTKSIGSGQSSFLAGRMPIHVNKARPLTLRAPLRISAQQQPLKQRSEDSFTRTGLTLGPQKARSEASADREPVALYHGATDRARAALKSTRNVTVHADGNRVAFMPKRHAKKQGLIIYPGAFVEHIAYAAVAHRIADKGYPVMIANMPFNVLGMNQDRASRIMEEFPQVKQWAVAGHSFGGLMTDFYALRHPNKEKLKGTVYWGTFPAINQSKNTKLRTLLLRGTNDNMLKKYAVLNYENNMPPNSQLIDIKGANHSYFADYGMSFGDGKAGISRDEQQEQVAKFTARFLDGLAKMP